MKVSICATEEQYLKTPLPNPPFVEVETFADLLAIAKKYTGGEGYDSNEVIVGDDDEGPFIEIYNGYRE